MNNNNIYLEIRNPKKQAIDMKLEAMTCYLMNQRTEEQRNGSQGTTGLTMVRVRVSAMCERDCDDTMAEAMNGGTGTS